MTYVAAVGAWAAPVHCTCVRVYTWDHSMVGACYASCSLVIALCKENSLCMYMCARRVLPDRGYVRI